MASPPCNAAVFNTFNQCIKQEPAIAALVLYAAITCVVLFLTLRYRNSHFMLFVPLTGLLEIGGFAARILYINE